MITFRYVPPFPTRAEVEAWCAARGYEVGHLERDPADTLWRGTCVVREVPGAIPAAPLDVS